MSVDRSDLPSGLDYGRHADLAARPYEPWARRVLLAILLAAVLAALAGAVGQRSRTSQVANRDVRVELRLPGTVRGGLLFEGSLRIHAIHRIAHPRVILRGGWLDGLQVNTIEPSPASEWSTGDDLELSYDDPIEAGDTFTLVMQFQLDPTNVGRSDNGVTVADGRTTLAHIDRSLRRLP